MEFLKRSFTLVNILSKCSVKQTPQLTAAVRLCKNAPYIKQEQLPNLRHKVCPRLRHISSIRGRFPRNGQQQIIKMKNDLRKKGYKLEKGRGAHHYDNTGWPKTDFKSNQTRYTSHIYKNIAKDLKRQRQADRHRLE